MLVKPYRSPQPLTSLSSGRGTVVFVRVYRSTLGTEDTRPNFFSSILVKWGDTQNLPIRDKKWFQNILKILWKLQIHQIEIGKNEVGRIRKLFHSSRRKERRRIKWWQRSREKYRYWELLCRYDMQAFRDGTDVYERGQCRGLYADFGVFTYEWGRTIYWAEWGKHWITCGWVRSKLQF